MPQHIRKVRPSFPKLSLTRTYPDVQHLDEEERDGGEFGPSSEEEEEEDDDAMDIDEARALTVFCFRNLLPLSLARLVRGDHA